MGIIHQSQTEIGIDILAEVDMVPAPVGVERRLDIAALADLGEHHLQQFLPLFHLMRTGSVVIVELFQTVELFNGHGIIHGQIKLTGVEFFFHRIPLFLILEPL